MPAFNEVLEECVTFIKRHELDAAQTAEKFTAEELTATSKYLGLKVAEGEEAIVTAERLVAKVLKKEIVKEEPVKEEPVKEEPVKEEPVKEEG